MSMRKRWASSDQAKNPPKVDKKPKKKPLTLRIITESKERPPRKKK